MVVFAGPVVVPNGVATSPPDDDVYKGVQVQYDEIKVHSVVIKSNRQMCLRDLPFQVNSHFERCSAEPAGP